MEEAFAPFYFGFIILGLATAYIMMINIEEEEKDNDTTNKNRG